MIKRILKEPYIKECISKTIRSQYEIGGFSRGTYYQNYYVYLCYSACNRPHIICVCSESKALIQIAAHTCGKLDKDAAAEFNGINLAQQCSTSKGVDIEEIKGLQSTSSQGWN